jgi:hypothetical protein
MWEESSFRSRQAEYYGNRIEMSGRGEGYVCMICDVFGTFCTPQKEQTSGSTMQ